MQPVIQWSGSKPVTRSHGLLKTLILKFIPSQVESHALN